MLPFYVGLFIGGPVFLTMFVSISYSEAAIEGTWLDLDYKQFKSCPNGEMVVGMCSSEARKRCGKTAHKIKCRKFNATAYAHVSPAETTTTPVDFSAQPDAKVCDAHSFMGGLCVSGGRADCRSSGKKVWNQMECRRGIIADDFETRDICADVGQSIECPKDDEGGAWAAIGMCSGHSFGLCHKLKCSNRRKPVRNMYGLRCARLKMPGEWSPVDFKQFKSCPSKQAVVGMCRSASKNKDCITNGPNGVQMKVAHKIRCRPMDPLLYDYSTTSNSQIFYGSSHYCSDWSHTVMGGFCVSGEGHDCGRSVSNNVECRSGYRRTQADVWDSIFVCGESGQDISCPKDDDHGVWVAVGMYSSSDTSACTRQKEFNSGDGIFGFRSKTIKNRQYGLKCVKFLRRKSLAPLEDGNPFQSCPSNEAVVGMCKSSYNQMMCRNGLGRFSATNIKCRPLDPELYNITTNPIKTEVIEEGVSNVGSQRGFLVQSCSASNMLIGGACISSDWGKKCKWLGGDKSVLNKMECRSGYEHEHISRTVIETRDVCGTFGQHIECPKDDDFGAWVATGMCSGLSTAECLDLKCASSTTFYGLRCVKIKKKLKPKEGGSWLPMDFRQFESCPENQVVVGMCRSHSSQMCKTDFFAAHKIRCRPMDPALNRVTINPLFQPLQKEIDEKEPGFSNLLERCSASNMLIGGFCVSSVDRECVVSGSDTTTPYAWNKMECRSGYDLKSNTVIETLDVCGEFGQDVECPKDDDVGVWAATGMCSGTWRTGCASLKCFRRNEVYGLRCVKFLREKKIDENPFQSCPSNEAVVGMCKSSYNQMMCRNGLGSLSATNIKCRPLDPELYNITTNPIKTEVIEEGVSSVFSWRGFLVQSCSASNMLIGGACISSDWQKKCKWLGGDKSVLNKMECRSGYEHEHISRTVIETRDVCGTFGQDIECPKDDDLGAWVATGMCSGLSTAGCPDLECPRKTTFYGLRCVKIKKSAKAAIEPAQNASSQSPATALNSSDDLTLPSDTDGNEKAGIASLSSGSGADNPTSDDEAALLVAQLMNEKEISGTVTKASCGLLFLITTMMLLLFN